MTPFLFTDIVIKFKPNSKHQRQSELNGSFSTRELMAGTSSGKNKSKIGPYRDSVLTWLRKVHKNENYCRFHSRKQDSQSFVFCIPVNTQLKTSTIFIYSQRHLSFMSIGFKALLLIFISSGKGSLIWLQVEL